MNTFLVAMRSPNPVERKRGADVVFVRQTERGDSYVILACECYESWEQWGAPQDVLADNLEDVETWRSRPANERRAIERGGRK